MATGRKKNGIQEKHKRYQENVFGFRTAFIRVILMMKILNNMDVDNNNKYYYHYYYNHYSYRTKTKK